MLVLLWLKNALFLNELKFLNMPLKVGHFLRIRHNLRGKCSSFSPVHLFRCNHIRAAGSSLRNSLFARGQTRCCQFGCTLSLRKSFLLEIS